MGPPLPVAMIEDAIVDDSKGPYQQTLTPLYSTRPTARPEIIVDDIGPIPPPSFVADSREDNPHPSTRIARPFHKIMQKRRKKKKAVISDEGSKEIEMEVEAPIAQNEEELSQVNIRVNGASRNTIPTNTNTRSVAVR